MDFNYKLMNIHSVIESVKTSFDYEAKAQGIDLITQEQDNLPDVNADPQRIGQVLRNLVSNAIKFTPEGKHITIKSELKNSSAITKNPYFEKELNNLNGDYVVVSVIDEGIGMKSDDILKAFENFTQIENSLSRKVGGTGLGLPIAKRFVKAHNGAIWCDSEENKGSIFYVAIPTAKQLAKVD
jgi:signal transduction histidine kinase